MMKLPTTNRCTYWLDLLPLEVCERIASHISPGSLTDSLRNFATTSEPQRRAVLSALSYKFGEHVQRSKCAPWVPLIRPDLVEVQAAPFVSNGFGTSISSEDITALLAAPNLRSAAVPDDRAFLHAITLTRSVRHLKVWVMRETSRDLLFEAISALNLESLVLVLRPYSPRPECLCDDVRFFRDDYNALAAACPDLKALTIKCRCCVNGSPVVRMLHTLPALTEVGLTMGDFPDISDASMARLRTLDSVNIETPRNHVAGLGPCAVHRFAVLLGIPVTTLSIDTCLDSEQISSLTNCPRLRKLDFKIAPGAEWALGDIVDKLPALRSLTLQWPPSAPWERRDAPFPDEAPYSSHIEVPSGAVLRIVEGAQELAELSLDRVHILLPEVLRILKQMGTRLQSFALSVRNHEEQLHCLNELLWTVVRCNPNLRAFRIEGTQRAQLVSSYTELARLRQSCLAALTRLERQALEVETTQLRSWLANVTYGK